MNKHISVKTSDKILSRNTVDDLVKKCMVIGDLNLVHTQKESAKERDCKTYNRES